MSTYKLLLISARLKISYHITIKNTKFCQIITYKMKQSSLKFINRLKILSTKFKIAEYNVLWEDIQKKLLSEIEKKLCVA